MRTHYSSLQGPRSQASVPHYIYFIYIYIYIYINGLALPACKVPGLKRQWVSHYIYFFLKKKCTRYTSLECQSEVWKVSVPLYSLYIYSIPLYLLYIYSVPLCLLYIFTVSHYIHYIFTVSQYILYIFTVSHCVNIMSETSVSHYICYIYLQCPLILILSVKSHLRQCICYIKLL